MDVFLKLGSVPCFSVLFFPVFPVFLFFVFPALFFAVFRSVFQLPDAYAAHGPAGVNHVLALVSATPRDFGKILGEQGAARATLINAAALQEGVYRQKKSDQATALYGAALIQLAEE